MKKANIIITVFITLGLISTSFGQDRTSRPDRGTEGKATQAQSEIDSVSLQNGNVSLNIPLASLPQIAGGKLSASISAYYNSKLYNAYSREKFGYSSVPGCQPRYSTSELGGVDSGGGWAIGGGYVLLFRDAHDDYDYIQPTGQDCFGYEFYHMAYRFFKPMLRSPDGSEHELRILSYYPTYGGMNEFLSGYYRYLNSQPYPTITTPLELYSVDGTYIKVVVNPPSYPVQWTAYMKDGTQVIQQADGQRIKDMNGNSILYGSQNNYSFIRDEQTGREIRTVNTTNGSQTTTQVQYQKVGGAWENMTIIWGSTSVQGKTYKMLSENLIPESEFPTCNIDMGFSTQIPVIREIILPATEQNAQPRKYTFGYNSDTTVQTTLNNPRWACTSQEFPPYTRTASFGMGELSQITTPTGAVYKYHYVGDGRHDFGTFDDGAAEVSRNVITSKEVIHDGVTDTWTYIIDQTGMASAGSVSNPDGSSYEEKFYPISTYYGFSSTGLGGLSYRTIQSGKVMTEKHWTLLGGVLTSIGSFSSKVTYNPVVDTEYTSLLDANGNRVKMSAKKFQYDYNGDLIQTTEYDWFDPSTVTFENNNFWALPTGVPVSATVLRVTNNSYYNQATDSNSTTAYHRRSVGSFPVILGLLKESTIGTSQTRASYDGLSYGIPPTKGNTTKVSNWDNVNNQWINTLSGYDSYGNVISKTDAKGNVTQIFYEDATHALPTKTIVDPQNGTGQQITQATYDFYTGATLTSTDINGNVSSISYTNHLLGAVDPFGRPGTTYSPYINIDGVNKRRTVKNYYEDSLRKTRTESDAFNEGDALLKSRTTSDQMGRTVLVEKNENGANTYTISTQTVYKTQDRVMFSSNPTRNIGESTDGWTRVTNDVLGRPIESATFSGSAQPPTTGGTNGSNFTGRVLTEYSYDATILTDQAGKQRRSIVNALGQLIRVDEPDSNGTLGTVASPTQPTNYNYDMQGNLVKVTQGSQNRYFMYDSLSRLIRVRQPEQTPNSALSLSDNVTGNNQWTIGSTYDANGNTLTTIDAKNIVINYSYDALNRQLTKTYNDGTPTVTYQYDNPNILNSKGQLTEISNSVSTSKAIQFDNFGKPLINQQITDGQIYTSKYKYNLSSELVEETYPSGRIISNEYNADTEISKILGKKNENSGLQTYANAIGYTATGAIEKIKLGNGRWESARFNSNLQVTELAIGGSVGNGNLWKLNYEYGELQANNTVDTLKNSGNIARQTINFNGLTNPIVQNYKYDSLDRVVEAKEIVANQTSWQQSFSYDRYGNRNNFSQVVNGNQLQINSQTLPNVDIGTNRFTTGQGYIYDFNGNLVQDSQGRQFTFNGDNKQTQVRDANNQIIGHYFYDGNGKRIKKVTALETTIFVYSGEKLVAEYSTQLSSSPTTSYTATDMIGSPRVITNSYGQVVSRRDFMPFGEEIAVGVGERTTINKYGTVDSVRQKFTGYQKDNETGLDFAEARMYNNSHGRFTAVDPLLASGKNADPQSFNRYTYSLNRPLNHIDPTGLQTGKAPQTKESKIVEWKISIKGDNKIAEGTQNLSKKDSRQLGFIDNSYGGYANINVSVTFKDGTNPSDYQSERAAVFGINAPNADIGLQKQGGTRNGSEENPGNKETVVDGQTKTIQDNPGADSAQRSETGALIPQGKQVLRDATYTAFFVQGERNKKTKELDSNVVYYALQIKYDKKGNIDKDKSVIQEIKKEDFEKYTGVKDPVNLLKPSN